MESAGGRSAKGTQTHEQQLQLRHRRRLVAAPATFFCSAHTDSCPRAQAPTSVPTTS